MARVKIFTQSKKGSMMALVRCQECGQSISEMALFCPVCGWPLREILAGLKGKSSRSRLRFNPLRRPGKIRLLLGMGLVYTGLELLRDPAFLGQDFMLMGQKLTLNPHWFQIAGAFLMVWGLLRAFYWGCAACGEILSGKKTTRCHTCLLPLTSPPTSK